MTTAIAAHGATAARLLALLVGLGPAAADATAQGPAGVTPEVQRSIRRGIDHLVRNQRPDGSWFSDGTHGTHAGAMTALATLAILADGNTPTRGPHWLTVRRAVDHMLRNVGDRGLLAPADEAVPMFSHGFTMLALAQVLGAEEDRARQDRIIAVLRGAIRLTAASQSRAGGWLYRPESTGDEGSVTITQVQGLRTCRDAGLTVPGEVIAHAVDYIHQSANPDGGIRYRAGQPGPSRAPITAAAVAVLHAAGRYDDPRIERMLRFATRTLPVSGRAAGHYRYAHRYLAQALWQCGGADWSRYYAQMSARLVATQGDDGAWPGEHVGPIYGTAMSLIVLQLPHALLPAHQR